MESLNEFFKGYEVFQSGLHKQVYVGEGIFVPMEGWALFEALGRDPIKYIEHVEEQTRKGMTLEEALTLLPENAAKWKKPIGRNSPCPCGSGKRYKNCCMGKDSLRNTDSLIDDKKAVEQLIGALKDEIWLMRYFGARTLGDMGDNKAVEPLIEVLKDGNLFVRSAAAKALATITKQDFGEDYQRWKNWYKKG